MTAYIILSIILIIGLSAQCFRLYRLNDRCCKFIRKMVMDHDDLLDRLSTPLHDYIEMMDFEMDVIGLHTEREMKLGYARDFINSARHMLTCIRMHKGGLDAD